MIYFMQAENSKRIKVGRVKGESSLMSRFRGLQTGSPEILTCLKTSEVLDETKTKNMFSHLRLHGEWFRARKDFLRFIKKLPSTKYDGMKSYSAFSPLNSRLLGSEARIRATTARIRTLTLREYQVLKHVANYKRNSQISAALHITEQTVKNHLRAAYAKIGISGRKEAHHLLVHLGGAVPKYY